MRGFDFYPTPAVFVHYLLDVLARHGRSPRGRVFAPCHGSGAIQAACESWPGISRITNWTTNDLDPRWKADSHLDAAHRSAWIDRGPIDFVIENPPFLKAIEIAEQAVAAAVQGVALHVRCTLNEPCKKRGSHAEQLRRSFLREHPPTGTLWLPRFKYQLDSASMDSATCVWLVWLRGVDRQFVEYAPDSVIDGAMALQRERTKNAQAARSRTVQGVVAE